MSGAPEIALVEDDAAFAAAIGRSLTLAGHRVRHFARAEPALSLVSPDWNGILLTDIRMPGLDGWQLFRRARAQDPDLPVILMTGHGDIPQAVEAVQAGAFDFLAKPFPVERLLERLERALAHRRLVLENRALRAALDAEASGPLIGRSAAIRALRAAVAELGTTDLNLLILGETGTGKEIVARMLHEASPRRRRRFVVLDCGGLPAAAPEELFGHVPGSFPGAARRVGRLELADGGTLYLDGIENLPPAIQPLLLRSLESREVTPLGSNQPRAVDLRVVASTSVGIDRLMADGRLRPELGYRLAGPQLTLPPLRDRREDIPLLFAHFRDAAARRLGQAPGPIPPELLDALMSRHWPGNVRELKSAAEQSLIAPGPGMPASAGRGLARQVSAFEAELIRQALAQAGGNVRRAADALELPLRTFYDKLARHGIASG